MNSAALARDRLALVALGASLPATTAFAYERHRARAYARALEDSGDAALGELAIAAASMPPAASVLAADGAALHLLLGDPGRSIASITHAAQGDAPLDTFGRDVLLAATREAPSEWRRAAHAATLVRHPRAAVVALGGAFDAMGDRRAYRAAVAAVALATALLALLALPMLLVEGGSPIAGVTSPSFAVPPSVVVVPTPARPPRRRAQPPDNVAPAPTSAPTGGAILVSAGPQGSPAAPPPGRPRVARPGQVGPTAGPVPAPTPTPQPTPQPQPAPAPAPTVSLAVATPAAPAPAAAPPPKANGKAKGHAKKAAKAAAAAAAPPAPEAAPPAPETTAPPSHEPPGQEKDKPNKDDKPEQKDK